ncbi:hypothetical protein LSH36_110g03074 [Paralvinella palmiformis]|uniref:Cytosolic fatty-acid binding proteins domain-containing protein n=1 Tax=Paralvinella palmiformis TaxID=53620 RepID=A0AAD9NAS6_9ANNE|nr:hypothetical protein LSH36_110g03074 [Paralvinella palmiformis]
MAPVDLSGTWKLVRSENFDEYLKEMNLIYLARKIANHITPVHEIEQDGDSFVIKISTPRGTQVMTFKIGEEFEQKVMSYQGDFTCKASWDDNKLVIDYTPKDSNKKTIKETREIVDDEYILIHIMFLVVKLRRVMR